MSEFHLAVALTMVASYLTGWMFTQLFRQAKIVPVSKGRLMAWAIGISLSSAAAGVGAVLMVTTSGATF